MMAAGTIILGIDPGTRVTGWGLVSVEDSHPRAVHCDVISAPAKWPIEQRLLHIFSSIGDIIVLHQPAVMAIEEPFVGENVRSAMAVGEARTVAMLAGTLAGLDVHHYAPARIKSLVAGYGQGDKKQVREMLRLQLGVNNLPGDLNATDALAVALCHAITARTEALIAQSAVTASAAGSVRRPLR